MRAFMYMRPGVKYTHYPDPQIVNPTDVKIKIHYASICGSDIHVANGELDHLYDQPKPFGHEAAGEIVELGPQATVKGLKVGDKVTMFHKVFCNKCFYCRNGQEHLCENRVNNSNMFAEYVVVDEQSVYKLPEGIDTLKGCMTEPVSVCMHGVDLLDIKPGYNVAIYGGGGLGLLTIQLVKLAGATNITLIEPIAEKRQLALELGATHVISPMDPNFKKEIMKITDGRGFQRSIEMSGSSVAAVQILETAARGSKIVYFANYNPSFKLSFDPSWFVNSELCISGVYQSPYIFPRVMSVLPVLKLDFLTANVYDFDNVDNAWDAYLSKKYPKIVLKISKDV